jgi:hypothetical protein
MVLRVSTKEDFPSGGLLRLRRALTEVFKAAVDDNALSLKNAVNFLGKGLLKNRFNKVIPQNILYYKVGFVSIFTLSALGIVATAPDQGLSLIATGATLTLRRRPTNSHMKAASATITTLHGTQYLLNGNIGGLAMALTSISRAVGLTVIPDENRNARIATALSAGLIGSSLVATSIDHNNPLTYLPFLSIAAGSLSDLLRDKFSHTARATRLVMCGSNMTYDTMVSHILGGVLTSVFSAKVLIKNALDYGDFKTGGGVSGYIKSLSKAKVVEINDHSPSA